MTENTQVQEMRIVKSDHEKTMQALNAVASVAILYYSLHPDRWEELQKRVRLYVARARHVLSVWQTRGTIRSYPETKPQ